VIRICFEVPPPRTGIPHNREPTSVQELKRLQETANQPPIAILVEHYPISWRYVNLGDLFTETGNFLCFGGLEEINYLQWDPEFVAEAEKTRMTLNPIASATLHNMIVEGLSMPAALKEKLKPILAPKG
jgi:hypothetical protein